MQKTYSTITQFFDIEEVIKAWLVKAKFRNTKKATIKFIHIVLSGTFKLKWKFIHKEWHGK